MNDSNRPAVMSRRLALVSLAGLAGLAFVPSAQATEFCNLRQTRDGFVALRSAPSIDAPMIARMRPQDEVLYNHRRRGKWIQVRWWRGESRHTPDGFAKARLGWVVENLVDDMCG